MTRARRVKREKWAVGMMVRKVRPKPTVPCVVMLMRCAPSTRRLDDDNLQGSLKACRDAVAQWLGVDDGSEDVRWVYSQERSRDWAVVVMIESDGEKELMQ